MSPPPTPTHVTPVRRTLALFLVSILAALVSCSPGTITIDRPEVFTRERLVNRRLAEQQWLEKKLDFDSLDPSFQGLRDYREFRAISIAADGNISLNPTVLPEGAASPNAETMAEGDSGGAPSSSGSNGDANPSSERPSINELQSSIKLPNPDEIVTTKASLTNVERLRDEKAYRDTINALLRETELDDGHDRNGYALYTLKFDIAVQPNTNNDWAISRDVPIGMAELAVIDDPGRDSLTASHQLLTAWRRHLLREVTADAITLQQLYSGGRLGAQQMYRLLFATEGFTDSVRRLFNTSYSELAGILNRSARPGPGEQGDTSSVPLPDANDTFKKNELTNINDQETLHRRALNLLRSADDLSRYDPCNPDSVQNFLHDYKSLSHTGTDRDILLKALERGPTAATNDDVERLLALAFIDLGFDFLTQATPPSSARNSELAIYAALSKVAEHRYKQLNGTNTGFFTFNNIPRCAVIDGVQYYVPQYWNPHDGEPHSKINWRTLSAPELIAINNNTDNDTEGPAELDRESEYLANFWTALYGNNSDSPGHLQPYVYTVDPKELAQNISDVAASDRLSSLALTLQASVPQAGSNASGNLSRIDREQERLHAIARHPLVVGYTKNPRERRWPSDPDPDTRFGWALGPRFEIGRESGLFEDIGNALIGNARTKATFRHAEVQHSVQATLAIPGWWDAVTLKPTTFWRRQDGRFTGRTVGKDMTVALPRDLGTLTTALLEATQNPPPSPVIIPVAGTRDAQYVVKEGEPAELLIPGLHLWRNPSVYIGNQRHTGVRVLTNMRGLHATFDAITPLADSSDRIADLTVVTSQGMTTLNDAVRIIPKKTMTTPKPSTFTLVGNAIFNKQSFTLTLPPNALPLFTRKGYVVYSDAATGRHLGDTEAAISSDGKKISVKATIDDDALKTGLSLRLTVSSTAADGTPVSISREADGKPAVFFKTKAEAMASVDPSTAPFVTRPNERVGQVVLNIKQYKKLLKAYPRLRDAMKSGFMIRTRAMNAGATDIPGPTIQARPTATQNAVTFAIDEPKDDEVDATLVLHFDLITPDSKTKTLNPQGLNWLSQLQHGQRVSLELDLGEGQTLDVNGELHVIQTDDVRSDVQSETPS